MNRNLFISVATVMLYASVQCALNVADARICFLVGGKCSDDTTLFDRTDSKDCDTLGYKKECPAGQVLDKSSPSCTEFGVTYYEKCKCDTDIYPVKASDVSSPYEVAGDVCTDDYGDHYKYKRCNSGYKYLSSSNNVSSYIGKCYQTYHNRDITIKNNDYVCTDACEEKDLLSTCPSNLTSIISTKYKSCSCNPDVFKYSAPQNSTVFKVSGACTDARGTHYKTKTCTGNAAAGGGYWGATCNNDEYFVPGDNKTEDGVTCHLCKKACTDKTLDDCKIALLSASTSANSKQCKKVGTNCYKLADGGVCPVEHICSDYTEGGVTLQSTPCGSGYTQTAYTKPIGSGNGTCYKCVEDKCKIKFNDNFDTSYNFYGSCFYRGACTNPTLNHTSCKEAIKEANDLFKSNIINQDFLYDGTSVSNYSSTCIGTGTCSATGPCKWSFNGLYSRLSKGECSGTGYEKICTGQPEGTCASNETFRYNGCTSKELKFPDSDGFVAQGARYGTCVSGSSGGTQGTARVTFKNCNYTNNGTCSAAAIVGQESHEIHEINSNDVTYDLIITNSNGQNYTIQRANYNLSWCYGVIQIINKYGDINPVELGRDSSITLPLEDGDVISVKCYVN